MNTIFNKNSLLSTIAISLFLTGCFNSSNSGTSKTTPTTANSISTALALQSANNEPNSLNAVMDVKNDISRLFGTPDGTPVDIKTGDTLKSVFDKVSN